MKVLFLKQLNLLLIIGLGVLLEIMEMRMSNILKHLKILMSLSIFCDPYCSQQKGEIENLNKLIRQYLPKRYDFAKITITNRDIYGRQEGLNNRPRKSNGYLTPNEVHSLYTKKAMNP